MSRAVDNPKRRRKSPMAAALLQCVPLLAATSCMASAASNQSSIAFLAFFLWWSVMLGGLGYLYLRRWARAALILAAGPLLAIGGVLGILNGSSFDYEHCPSVMRSQYDCSRGLAAADADTAGLGLLVGALVTLTAVDAGRLAEQWNLGVDSSETVGSDAEAPA
jgi:hypothetical protein